MFCSSEGGASVPVSVVQEGHKRSVTGAECEEGGGYSLHVEVPIVYDVTVATSGQGAISCRDMIESHYCHRRHQVRTSTRHASDVLWMSNIADMSAIAAVSKTSVS